MDVDNLPDEYWIIQTRTSFFRVDALQAAEVLEGLRGVKQLVDIYRAITIIDLSGSTCNIVLKAVNEVYFSNVETRERDRQFTKKIDKEGEEVSW